MWWRKKSKFNFAEAYFQNAEDKVKDAYEHIPFVKKQKSRGSLIRMIKIVSYTVLAIFIFFVISAIVFGVALRNTYYEVLSGKENIDNAIYFAKIKDFSQSLDYASSARDNFETAHKNFLEIKNTLVARYFPVISSQFKNVDSLLYTASLVSESMYQSIEFTDKLDTLLNSKNIRFSQFNREEKRAVISYIYESSDELISLKEKLDLAQSNIDKVKFPIYLNFVNVKIAKMGDQISQARFLVQRAIPASKILPALLGYPDKKSYLFLLQNKDELRPTGGFIGTYGIVVSDSGDFSRFETHDVYHLDMPVKDKLKVAPPAPIKKYLVPNWFMRDANWSPDFPISARQVAWFYNTENALQPIPDEINKFDGIIAVTPTFITDLLSITGPIIIEGQEYNKDNFVKLLEYRVEKGYVQLGESSWNRKEVIGAISKELKYRIFDLDASNWIQVLNIVNKNIDEKNILLYFFDPDLENLAIAENMGGEVKPAIGDYVMVVDANMGALKTDAAMNKSLKYTVQQKDDGVYALLEINYSHQGRVDYRTGQYKSYTRVFVPKGSKLLKVNGPLKADIIVKEELDKTVFENFITIDPGKMDTLEILYKLPDKIRESLKNGRYELYMQKQPGNDMREVMVDLQLANVVQSYMPGGLSSEKIGSNEIRWKADLLTDKSFEAVLSK